MFNNHPSTLSDESISSILSDLLHTGRVKIEPEKTRYVCHTSTIPLCTTVDEQSLLRDCAQETVEVSHSIKYQPGYDEAVDYRCCKKHCMYANAAGKFESEFLRSNCPCGGIVSEDFDQSTGEEIDRFLQPLCFLQVLKELRYDFGYQDSSVCESDVECCHNDFSARRSNRPRIELDEIMFCPNSQSILDTGYSRPLRDRVGFDGWIAANTPERIGALFANLYWFKFVSDKVRNLMSKEGASNFRVFKTCVEQALHTVNGLLCKKFLCFPCEMEGYRKLAQLTAQVFEEVMIDYLRPIGWAEPTMENSIFVRMKSTFKNIKRAFCSEVLEMRLQCLDLIESPGIKHCKFAKFFQPSVTRLRRRISSLREKQDIDYSLSISWINSFSGLSQTRNLGYLPPWVADVKRKQFRDTVGREKVQVNRDQLHLIRALVQERLFAAKIEKHFLSTAEQQCRKDFEEVINSIKIPLKPTASVRSTVHQGGKVEDARQLLNLAMENHWKVPVRDLATGDVEKWIQLSPQLAKERETHEGFIFWIALQLVLNWFATEYRIYRKYFLDLPGQEPWIEELWRMTIVHISEPGKERNLTKTSSLLAWVLTVVSKVCQMILAYSMDHRAGLVLSAQDWMHQRRVASGSYESDWMYDRKTRKRIQGVWNGFQDWTESTDYIPRQIGGAALSAFFSYIDFPRWFSKLTLLITQRDFDVSEYTHTEWTAGVTEKHYYNGKVQEGFMMSMPLTKTILHLMHDVNIGAAHAILRKLGIRVVPPPDTSYWDPESNVYGQFTIKPEDVQL
nr:MAG: RNA dependent RNA polymerase [Moniliophthora roreri-associated narnavirus]